jgi:hypothetical protein
MNHDRYFYTLGQISGYAAGIAAWMNFAKDVIGFIGIIAGATLSVWALWDRFKNRKKDSRD